MKVLLINGSPHADGYTFTALSEVAKTLETEGIQTQIFQIGKAPVRGCIACGACAKLASARLTMIRQMKCCGLCVKRTVS